MTHQSLLVKSSLLGGLLGVASLLMFSNRRHSTTTEDATDEDFSTILRNEQEEMRMKREDKRQTPVLTYWEREL